MSLDTDKKAIEELIATFSSYDEEAGFNAALAIGKFGKAAVEPLLEVLQSDNYLIRCNALASLGFIKDEQAVLPIISMLSDSSNMVRSRAVGALREIGDKRAVPALIQCLHNDDSHVQFKAILALGEIADPRAVEPLLSFVDKASPSTWEILANTLGHLRDIRALPKLKKLWTMMIYEEYLGCDTTDIREAIKKATEQIERADIL